MRSVEKCPHLKSSHFSNGWRTYARFTAVQAEEYIQRGEDLASLEARLHRNAHRLGQRLRERFGITRQTDVMALASILYHIIDIDFEGSPQGDIVIRRCYFSQFYSPRVCGLISALDEGLLVGLAGGGTLTFTERITQGCDACKARFLNQTCILRACNRLSGLCHETRHRRRERGGRGHCRQGAPRQV